MSYLNKEALFYLHRHMLKENSFISSHKSKQQPSQMQEQRVR